MSHAEPAPGPRSATSPGRRATAALRWISPPTHTIQFWIVQAGVVGVAFLHEYLLDDRHDLLPLGYPTSMTASLLLVPVIYAALNFGVRGSVATGLWATALMVPDILEFHADSRRQAWIETSILVVVNAVAIVVGQRVERERQARQRAEHALHASERAELRYRTLFEGQHAPILVVNHAGRIVEANHAALTLFGPQSGSAVATVLPAPLLEQETPDPQPIEVREQSGTSRWLLPSVRALPIADSDHLTQIVLTDVTSERRREEEQRSYAANLIRVQEDERRRLARDLHDDPLQALTFLARSLRGLSQDEDRAEPLAAELARDGDLAEQTAHALREIIRGLRPPILDDLGLVPALQHLATEVRERCGLPVDVLVKGAPVRQPPEVELVLFRITQEALTNTVHHAKARRAVVTLDLRSAPTLTVHDDGVGVASSGSARTRGGGMGIPGMRERLAQVGGTLTINRGKAGGTVVTATIPAHSRPGP